MEVKKLINNKRLGCSLLVSGVLGFVLWCVLPATVDALFFLPYWSVPIGVFGFLGMAILGGWIANKSDEVA